MQSNKKHSIIDKHPECYALLSSLLSRFKNYYSQYIDKLDLVIWERITQLIDTFPIISDMDMPDTCNIHNRTFFDDLNVLFKEYKFDSLLVMTRFNENDYVQYPRKKLKLLQDIFINESKYITEQLQEKIKNKKPILDIIYFTALKRKEIAFLQCDPIFNRFSNLRIEYDEAQSPIEGSNARHLIPYIYHTIIKDVTNRKNDYKKQMQKAIENGNTKLIKSLEIKIKYTYIEPSVGEDLFDSIIESNLESDSNRTISLTRMALFYDTEEDKIQNSLKGLWVHTSFDKFPSIFKELEYLYSQLIVSAKLESKIELIGKLWWWFCQAMPFSRGSAAIAEFIFNNMIDYYTNHKYRICDSIDSPTYLSDIHALTYDKEHFVKIFHTQFLCDNKQKTVKVKGRSSSRRSSSRRSSSGRSSSRRSSSRRSMT